MTCGMTLTPASFLLAVALFLTSLGATTAFSQSDAERLEKLERAVELLQQRNTELEQEVRSLKGQTAATPAKEKLAAKFVSDGKGGPQPPPPEEDEKKPVFAAAATSEFKLALGGFIQAQVEAGDVSAFEGRFTQGSGEIKDRFRIRRARISLSGDYTEHFDFKAEGDFSQSYTTLTVRGPHPRFQQHPDQLRRDRYLH